MYIYIHWTNNTGSKVMGFHHEDNAASYVFDCIGKKIGMASSMKKKTKELPSADFQAAAAEMLQRVRAARLAPGPGGDLVLEPINAPPPLAPFGRADPLARVIEAFDEEPYPPLEVYEATTKIKVAATTSKELIDIQSFISNTKERSIASSMRLIELWEIYAAIHVDDKTIAHTIQDVKTFD